MESNEPRQHLFLADPTRVGSFFPTTPLTSDEQLVAA